VRAVLRHPHRIVSSRLAAASFASSGFMNRSSRNVDGGVSRWLLAIAMRIAKEIEDIRQFGARCKRERPLFPQEGKIRFRLVHDRHRYIDHFSVAIAATVDPVCFGLT
jgi:hypothetical protein